MRNEVGEALERDRVTVVNRCPEGIRERDEL
jgi:hypothetical protein